MGNRFGFGEVAVWPEAGGLMSESRAPFSLEESGVTLVVVARFFASGADVVLDDASISDGYLVAVFREPKAKVYVFSAIDEGFVETADFQVERAFYGAAGSGD